MKERLIKFLNKILLLGKEKENNKDYVAYTKALNGENIDDGYVFLELPHNVPSLYAAIAGILYIQYKDLAYKLKEENKLSILAKIPMSSKPFAVIDNWNEANDKAAKAFIARLEFFGANV